MNKPVTKFLKIAIPLGLGVFLIWYLYNSFTPAQIAETKTHFKNANYGFVLLSVVLSVLSHVSRSYRWRFMLSPLGYKPKLANSFMAVSVAYLMNIFIPKSGEVSRAIVLDKYEGVPFEKGFGTIISERVVDLIFLLGFTLIALVLKYDALYAYISETISLRTLCIFIGGLLALLIGLPLFLKFSKSNLNTRIKKFLFGLKEGIFSIANMNKKGPFLIHTFIIWGLYLLSFYCALFALPETASISFGTIIIAFVVGSFTFAFTNSGFGTYPAAVAGILSLFGVSATVGVAFGWIVWTSNIVSIVFFGVLSFLILPFYNRSKS